MEEGTWRLANNGLSFEVRLDEAGKLSTGSLLHRATGREWLHPRLPSEEILLEAALEGEESRTLDGSSGWDLVGERKEADAQWKTLELTLASRLLPLAVHRLWAVYRRLPVLRQALRVENTGDRSIELRRADTFRIRLSPVPQDLQLRWLNNYCRGLKPRPSHPVHTRSVGENIRHTIETGPYSPDCAWFTLSIPGMPEEGIVGGWEWSGPMVVGFGDWDGPCLLGGGLATDGMRERLPPGASFPVPAGWLGFYQGGIDEASHLSQRYAAIVAPPPVRWKAYPTLGYCTWSDSLDGEKSPYVPRGSNPWFPTEENLLSQVAAAADAGFDLFILDYGWFPRVGDWWCDRERFPAGPERIVRAVKDRGMRLGLWMGFAAADPESAVVKEHPEWLARYGGAPIPDAFPFRSSAKVWGTRVLCLGHRPVVAWATEQIDRVVRELEVDWLKHDFDTVTLCQAGEHTHTPGDGRVASCQGFYDVLDEVSRRHPDLVIDNWESDSALPDYGMIRRHRIHLVGDAYAAFLLRQMFYGASRLFPQAMLHRYLRLEDSDTDMRTSMRSAMVGGPLTILSDPRKWTPEQLETFREEASLYRRVRHFFREGLMYCPLGRPTATGWDAFQFNGRRGGVLFVFRNDNAEASIRVPLRGLDDRAKYLVGSTEEGRSRMAPGGRLMREGIAVTLARPRSAAVFEYALPANEKR